MLTSLAGCAAGPAPVRIVEPGEPVPIVAPPSPVFASRNPTALALDDAPAGFVAGQVWLVLGHSTSAPLQPERAFRSVVRILRCEGGLPADVAMRLTVSERRGETVVTKVASGTLSLTNGAAPDSKIVVVVVARSAGWSRDDASVALERALFPLGAIGYDLDDLRAELRADVVGLSSGFDTRDVLYTAAGERLLRHERRHVGCGFSAGSTQTTYDLDRGVPSWRRSAFELNSFVQTVRFTLLAPFPEPQAPASSAGMRSGRAGINASRATNDERGTAAAEPVAGRSVPR